MPVDPQATEQRNPNWRLRFITFAVCVATLFAACAFLRISKCSDVRAYIDMASSFHPVWKQFALRQFGPGDSAKRLFQRFPPTRSTEFGRYGIYSFWGGPPGSIPFSSFTVTTRDGKLLGAGAGSCTWSFTFFNTPDPGLDRQYAALMAQQSLATKQQTLDLMALHLKRFYAEHNRWPTNEGEFGTFVTGEKPPLERTQSNASQFTRDQQKFRERYGLDLPAGPFNPLGITLSQDPNGELCVAFGAETSPASIAQARH